MPCRRFHQLFFHLTESAVGLRDGSDILIPVVTSAVGINIERAFNGLPLGVEHNGSFRLVNMKITVCQIPYGCTVPVCRSCTIGFRIPSVKQISYPHIPVQRQMCHRRYRSPLIDIRVPVHMNTVSHITAVMITIRLISHLILVIRNRFTGVSRKLASLLHITAKGAQIVVIHTFFHHKIIYAVRRFPAHIEKQITYTFPAIGTIRYPAGIVLLLADLPAKRNAMKCVRARRVAVMYALPLFPLYFPVSHRNGSLSQGSIIVFTCFQIPQR